MQPSPDSSNPSSSTFCPGLPRSLRGPQLAEVSLLSAPGRCPMAVTQTSLWLPGPRRVLDGRTQVSLGILEALPP